MSFKVHFQLEHLDFYPENTGYSSGRQEKEFHQDLTNMKKLYQGRCNSIIIGDYCKKFY